MTLFFRLLEADDKAAALRVVARSSDARVYEVDPKSFGQIPGSPFAYWASNAVRKAFSCYQALGKQALVTSGTGTLDDFRFLRSWWELSQNAGYFPFAKGGAFSLIYYDHHLVVQWKNDGREMKAWIIHRYSGGHWARNIRSTEHYFRPGLTWPRRTTSGLALRALPKGCIFADKGPAAFVADDLPEALLSLLAITNSRPFRFLVSLQLAAADAAARSYEVGIIQRTPLPEIRSETLVRLAGLTRRAWSLKRTLDTVDEISHAFLLPKVLRDPPRRLRSAQY
jgi:hypothetical protein